MRNPKLIYSILQGVLGFAIVTAIFVGVIFIVGSLNTITFLIGWTLGIGVFFGLQIHIIRKLKWFEAEEENEKV